jgi:hypothetical protein
MSAGRRPLTEEQKQRNNDMAKERRLKSKLQKAQHELEDLDANNLPGRESNIITDLPLYSLATIINVRVLVKKDMLDTLLNNAGNLFIVINKHIYSYPSIASHDVTFNPRDLIGALHCNAGSEAEKLYNIKRVNIPIVGGYYNKYQKYLNKLK